MNHKAVRNEICEPSNNVWTMIDSVVEMNLPPITEKAYGHFVKEFFVRELTDVDSVENKNKPEIFDKIDTFVHDENAVHLSKGLLSSQAQNLRMLSKNLKELNKNQIAVIETLQEENLRFLETQKMYNLENIFFRAKYYSTKLQHIKREMSSVHEKSNKLKKRALRLQQQKQKEAFQKELQRDQEVERDKQLAPKMAAKC